jgi:hypothetical protein
MQVPVFRCQALCFAQKELSLELFPNFFAHADLAYFTLLNWTFLLQDHIDIDQHESHNDVRPDNTMSGTKRDAISVQKCSGVNYIR